MSKKITGLKDIALAKPVTIIPKTQVDTEQAEKSTAKIHGQKVVRISVDLPPDFYRKLKHDAFDANMTLKAYVMKMIEAGYEK